MIYINMGKQFKNNTMKAGWSRAIPCGKKRNALLLEISITFAVVLTQAAMMIIAGSFGLILYYFAFYRI